MQSAKVVINVAAISTQKH